MDSLVKGFTTKIVHNDRQDAIEHGSLHKPIHANVAYGYADAKELAAVFQGEKSGYSYGRQVNPTITALESKMTVMEDGIASVCFATGMAAIGTTMFSLLRAGDHLVSSAFLFGNTNSLFNTFDKMGIGVNFVDATSVAAVAAAVTEKTKMVFIETIANPRTQIADLQGIGKFCAQRGLVYVVDNTMTSPYLFQPKTVGASLVVNSLTKYIGGHGNALGGVVTEMGSYDWSNFTNIYPEYQRGEPQKWGITQIKKKGLRDFGASLGPEAAHHIAMGAETLALRVQRQSDNAMAMCHYLSNHPQVKKVYYPGLSEHAQHARATDLFRAYGGLFSFELQPEVDLWQFLNRLQVIVKSSNLGDNRTLAIPVAHTIYFEMGAERRASMGIDESLIRISSGIEDIGDLLADLDEAFAR
ncbi:MAG TPA: cystathionine gamma-synthase family protein [Gammaproteobacteria bacterium]|nr:cystathionine gamma-synthase family protein [Gammaproteobacteria bacterium]